MQLIDWESTTVGRNFMVFYKKKLGMHQPIEISSWLLLQRLSGASLLVFANKTDVNGCMGEAEIQEACRLVVEKQRSTLTASRGYYWTPSRRINGISFDAVLSQVQIFKRVWRGWFKMPKQDYFCIRNGWYNYDFLMAEVWALLAGWQGIAFWARR